MLCTYAALRGKIVEKFGTQSKFAETLGISDVAMSKKMNGKIEFSKSDIERWMELLDISKDDVGKYFFA